MKLENLQQQLSRDWGENESLCENELKIGECYCWNIEMVTEITEIERDLK